MTDILDILAFLIYPLFFLCVRYKRLWMFLILLSLIFLTRAYIWLVILFTYLITKWSLQKPKLLLILSPLSVFCVLLFLKAIQYHPIGATIWEENYKEIYWFLILFSIWVSLITAVGCSKLFKKPAFLFSIPIFSQLIGLGLMIPYGEWLPPLTIWGGNGFGLCFLATSLFFFWIGGSLLAAILYGVLRKKLK